MKWLVGIVAAIYVAILASHISYVAGGPDESGYMNEARMLRSGRTHIEITPLRTLHLDDSWAIQFTPLGFSPRGHEMVPVYPAGYPIHLLIASLIGAQFFVVPLAALGSIALTYFIARELELSFWYAVGAAAILAADATFVLQATVVMSDVLATFWGLVAIWLALRVAPHLVAPHPPFGHLLPARGEKGLGVSSLASTSSLAPRSGERVAEGRVRGSAFAYAAGAAFAIGVWVRPTNLLIAIPLLIALRFRIVRAILGALPFAIALFIFNAKTYGSALSTGYGSAAVFTFGDCFWEQLRYLVHIVSPAIVVGGPLVLFDRRANAWTRALLFAWIATFIAFYGCWQVCDNWTLTRFLLPATPALILGAVLLLRDLRLPKWIAAIVVLAILAYSVDKWHKRHILGVARDQQIYPGSVRVAQQLVPRDAMLVTGLLSGTFFNYGNGQFTVRWDTLDPDRFAQLRARTKAKWYAVLSRVEVPMSELTRRLPGRWTPIGSYRNVVIWRLDS